MNIAVKKILANEGVDISSPQFRKAVAIGFKKEYANLSPKETEKFDAAVIAVRLGVEEGLKVLYGYFGLEVPWTHDQAIVECLIARIFLGLETFGKPEPTYDNTLAENLNSI